MEENKQLRDIDQAISIIKTTLDRMESLYSDITSERERFVTEFVGVRTGRGDYISVDEVRIQLLNDIAETSKKLSQMVDIRVNNEKKAEELIFIKQVLGDMNKKAASINIGGEKIPLSAIEEQIEKEKSDGE